MNARGSHAYINDFLYFVISPDAESAGTSLLLCSGVNIDRFMPITRGRHRPMSNPAIRGLQLLGYDIRALILSKGATPVSVAGDLCSVHPPTEDIWSREQLRISNASESLPDEIIEFGVIELLRKIDKGGMLQARMPDTLLPPAELQEFLEGLCIRYGNQKAWGHGLQR